MFGRSKQSDEFYELFKESTGKIQEAAWLLKDLTDDYSNLQEKTRVIKEKELECDLQTHKMIQTLNAAFITPFDREDIFQITKELDNIVDMIEETANRFMIFRVLELRPEALAMADLIVKCVCELKTMFDHLDTIGQKDFVHNQIIEINRLENEGDVINRQALARLFAEETDAVEIIKWKQLFELLEATVDVCEEVANLVEGLIMKHSQ
jgi:uncharacterized protein